MRVRRRGHAAGALNGRMYIAGGRTSDGNYASSAAVYDPSTDEWADIGDMGTGRDGVAGAVLGRVLTSAYQVQGAWRALPWTLARQCMVTVIAVAVTAGCNTLFLQQSGGGIAMRV